MSRPAELMLKRAYEDPSPADGHRVLVDRLWPRGLRRDAAAIDTWLGAVAPSPDLRTWWHHDPGRFDEFARRYRTELSENPALDDLAALARTHPRLTLVFGARDPAINHAVVLRDALVERLGRA